MNGRASHHPDLDKDAVSAHRGWPNSRLLQQLADPWIGLASAAAVTRTHKLGTGVCLVTERNPILLAKEIATPDHLSEGRVVLGDGTGWLKEDVESLGSHFSRRWLRLRESIEAIRELWTKEEAEYHGRVIDFPAVRCIPQPAQKRYPPVLLGSHGEKGLQRVARWAEGWCPLAHGPAVLRKNLKMLKHLMEEARCAQISSNSMEMLGRSVSF